MYKKIVLIVFFVLCSSKTFAEMKNISPTIELLLLKDTSLGTITVTKQFEETSYYIKSVAFPSGATGWAVGAPHWDQSEKQYMGTIIKTIDTGKTWTAQSTGVVKTFNDVAFTDVNHGWAVGADGTIIHTANSGNNWDKQTVATTDEFLSVAFADSSTGWATTLRPIHFGFFNTPDNWEAAVWHTVNGGLSWTKQTVPVGAAILRGLSFVNAQTGWMVGIKYTGDDQYGSPEHVPAIYHTTNGGQTWTEQYTPNLKVSLTTAHFIDTQHGWAAGFPTNSMVEGGFVFHTTDGGETWERQEPGGIFSPLQDIQFIDANRGYVVGFDYTSAWGPPVWRTMDGGATWEKVLIDQHESDGLFGVTVTEDRVLALGDHDFIMTSDDPWGTYPWPNEGDLFSQAFINTHFRFDDVIFTDQNHGWVVGRKTFTPEYTGQVIFNTQDGGSTWIQQYEHAPDLDSLFSFHRLDSVFFVDNQNGWAVGTSESFLGSGGWEHHGAIMHTSDGGQTWQEQGQNLYEGRDREFLDVQFLDSDNGWALATNKFPDPNIHLAQTTDGGALWQWVDTGIEGSMAIGLGSIWGSVHFTDTLHGWAVGGLGNVIHTTDGGATWNNQASSTTSSRGLLAVDFIDDQNGIIGGEGIFQTKNDGANWTKQNIAIGGIVQDVQLLDNKTGWIVGERGTVMYTNNGGSRWYSPNSDTPFSLRGLSFIDQTHGWIVGDAGTILRITGADQSGQ